MEQLAQQFRALANHNRIRILRLLCVLGEMNVTRLAEATGLVVPLVSDHLRILTTAGWTRRRRSGRLVYYRPADEDNGAVATAVWAALRSAFSDVHSTDPRVVADADQAHSATRSDQALFAYFTAFTHPRRLQIIQCLNKEQPVVVGELASRLSMSPLACLRHVDKLMRRSFVRRRRSTDGTGYALRRGNGREARQMLEAVRVGVSAGSG